jgi:hypothetical protein
MSDTIDKAKLVARLRQIAEANAKGATEAAIAGNAYSRDMANGRCQIAENLITDIEAGWFDPDYGAAI